MAIAELEAALQTRWDDETLAVYADALVARGDPRGELIALDLHAARAGGATPELDAARLAKLRAWLGGGDWPLGRAWRPSDVRFGFVDGVSLDGARLAEVMSSPAGRFVRGVRVVAEHVDPAIADLAARPMPWLRRLALASPYGGPISERRLAALAAAAPHLDELALENAGLVDPPGLPSVRALRVVGDGSDLRDGEWPHVRELDLGFSDDDDDFPDLYASLVRRMPALARLDLARNERRFPSALTSNVGVWPLLRAIDDVLLRVRELRVPALRVPRDADAVHELLARHAHLVVEVARAYREPPLAVAPHPRLRLPAAPRPWPPQTSSRNALTITVAHLTSWSEDLSLSDIIEALDDGFDALAPYQRTAWLALWEFLEGLRWDDPGGQPITLPFDGATLAVALESLPDDGRCARGAAMIREAALPPGGEVALRRYWGW